MVVTIRTAVTLIPPIYYYSLSPGELIHTSTMKFFFSLLMEIQSGISWIVTQMGYLFTFPIIHSVAAIGWWAQIALNKKIHPNEKKRSLQKRGGMSGEFDGYAIHPKRRRFRRMHLNQMIGYCRSMLILTALQLHDVNGYTAISSDRSTEKVAECVYNISLSWSNRIIRIRNFFAASQASTGYLYCSGLFFIFIMSVVIVFSEKVFRLYMIKLGITKLPKARSKQRKPQTQKNQQK